MDALKQKKAEAKSFNLVKFLSNNAIIILIMLLALVVGTAISTVLLGVLKKNVEE